MTRRGRGHACSPTFRRSCTKSETDRGPVDAVRDAPLEALPVAVVVGFKRETVEVRSNPD